MIKISGVLSNIRVDISRSLYLYIAVSVKIQTITVFTSLFNNCYNKKKMQYLVIIVYYINSAQTGTIYFSILIEFFLIEKKTLLFLNVLT